MKPFRGHYIDGQFITGDGTAFTSKNPARNHEVVFEARDGVRSVDDAVSAARRAAPAWRRLSFEQRANALTQVALRVAQWAEPIANAIASEMGKSIGESLIEAKSIKGKIDGVIANCPGELAQAPVGAPGEQRFHAMGVMAIVGPFNFPIHLLNTHIIPALLTGNTVVVKPSEVTPLCGQLYAELFHEAGVPRGVFNLVQGEGMTGAALTAHEGVDAVVFTGSYETGRRIRQATFDQPWKKVCLELGGKNVALVLDDAHVEQTVRELVLGAFLTTGQRCTATSRLVLTPGIADAVIDSLCQVLPKVSAGDPFEPSSFMGPLATQRSQANFLQSVEGIQAQGAQLIAMGVVDGSKGAFVPPSIFKVTGEEKLLSEEFFGPNLCIEIARDEADAFARAGRSDYGLSGSVFSKRPEVLERFYDEVRVGVVNFNRSTNGASGLLPFGGTGKSGNWRPAGSVAPRLATYPVAVMKRGHGELTPHALLDDNKT
jgi:succinylglutamic semialdehyde dehydrogenase